MGWIYILVRNYPWWAIPIGLTILFEAFRRQRFYQSKVPWWLFVIGFSLIASSIFFLYYQGHVKAVPFVHEVLKDASQ